MRFERHTAGRGGWSEWIFPATKQNYLMKCCDCGLVHELQFNVFAEVKPKRGRFEIVKMPWPLRAMFRVRRSRVKGT